MNVVLCLVRWSKCCLFCTEFGEVDRGGSTCRCWALTRDWNQEVKVKQEVFSNFPCPEIKPCISLWANVGSSNLRQSTLFDVLPPEHTKPTQSQSHGNWQTESASLTMNSPKESVLTFSDSTPCYLYDFEKPFNFSQLFTSLKK